MIALLIFGAILLLGGAALVITGADYNDDLLSLGGLFLAVIGVLMILGSTGVLDGPPECEEHGTVMVVVDGDKRCVPWEQAPDLQDFPQP